MKQIMIHNKLKELELVKDFIKDYLHNNIKELITFTFFNIINNKKYAGTQYNKSEKDFDGDRTAIVYAIDYLVWKDKGLPCFSSDNFNKIENSYSGDTINTFNTLFGSTSEKTERIIAILNLTDKEIKMIDDFKKCYQTIGNFYMLPKNTVNRVSINSYRGIHWNDYFDIFLNFLESGLEHNASAEKDFMELLKANEFFFKAVPTIDIFFELFYLEDYKEFKLNGKGIYFDHTMLTKENAKEYKTFAFDYINKTTVLINKRSIKIINALENKYPELIKN